MRLDNEENEGGQLLTAVQNEISLMRTFRDRGLTKYIIKLVDAEVRPRRSPLPLAPCRTACSHACPCRSHAGFG